MSSLYDLDIKKASIFVWEFAEGWRQYICPEYPITSI